MAAAATLLFAWLGLWDRLRIDWTFNEQYQYGWFVPPLALALLALRGKDRPEPRPWGRAARWGLAVIGLLGLLLLAPLRLTEGPNPDWRLIYWLHGAALFALSLALAAWCGGWPWVRHFVFPIGFLLMAIPWPSEPEQKVIQSLMRGVAAIAAECMAVLGVPAVAQGNVISVHGQLIGVNEACSGIRSLQTTLMTSLFLGELSRLSIARRFWLLAGGVGIAFLANIFRSSSLVWIAARSGIPTLEHYHDATGIAVLLIVFAALLGLNSFFSRRVPVPPVSAKNLDHPAFGLAMIPLPVLVGAALAWLLAVEVATFWWYSTAPAVSLSALPHWTIRPPIDAPDFAKVPIDERSASMLRFDAGTSLRWTRDGENGERDDCTLFFFRWAPGHASSLQADMHQPHICLTASGLTQVADWGVRPLRLDDTLTLPVRRYEFSLRGRSLYVFFVVWQDGVTGRPDEIDEPGSRAARIRAVLDRHPIVGRQTLEFLVTGPTSAEKANTLFERELLSLVKRQD